MGLCLLAIIGPGHRYDQARYATGTVRPPVRWRYSTGASIGSDRHARRTRLVPSNPLSTDLIARYRGDEFVCGMLI